MPGLPDIAIGIALTGVNKFKQDIGSVSNDVSKSTNSMGSMLKSFAGAVGIAFGVNEMINFGRAAVDLAAKLEQDTVVFETMLGSAEAAQKQLKILNDFATRTPFQIDGLIEADKLLINFGRTAEQSVSDLKILGDISGGNEERFKSLSLVFGQVASAGRLMGQDLLQLINAGFNPLQVISEKTGKSVAELKDDVSKGKITFDVLRDAMVSATSEGGKFFNLMEKQSQTTSGLISTLKDNFAAIQREIGQQLLPVVNAVVKGLLANIDKMKEWINIIINGIKNGLNPLWDIMSDIGSIFTDLNAIFGDSISFGDILSGVFKVLGLVIKSVYLPVTLLIKGLSKVVELARWIGEELGLITRDFEYFGERVKKDFGDAAGFVKEFAKQTGGTKEQISEFVKTIDLNSVANMKYADGIKFLKDKWEEFVKPAETASQAIQQSGDGAGHAAGSLAALKEELKKLQTAYEETGSAFERTKIADQVEILEARIKFMTDGFETLKTKNIEVSQSLMTVSDAMTNQDSRLEGLTDTVVEQQDEVNKLALAWGQFSAQLKDVANSVFPQLKQMGIDALGNLAIGFGASIAGGESFRDVLIKIGQELAVQVPKMLGFALLNASTTAQPWYVALALAASGLTLLGLSGYLSAKIAEGQNTPNINPAGIGGNALSRESGSQGLSDFQATEANTLNLQGAFDGAELTMKTEDGSFRATVLKSVFKDRKLKGK